MKICGAKLHVIASCKTGRWRPEDNPWRSDN